MLFMHPALPALRNQKRSSDYDSELMQRFITTHVWIELKRIYWRVTEQHFSYIIVLAHSVDDVEQLIGPEAEAKQLVIPASRSW